jgi:hypothetical protein
MFSYSGFKGKIPNHSKALIPVYMKTASFEATPMRHPFDIK